MVSAIKMTNVSAECDTALIVHSHETEDQTKS